MPTDQQAHELLPLPYHQAMLQYIQTRERDLWDWFASTKVLDDRTDSARLDLLKSTYRIDRETAPELYQQADKALATLGIDAPLTFYQSQNTLGANAAMVYIPGEIHIVLVGPVTEMLSEDELLALLGHEMAHFLLNEGWEGQFRVVAEILAAMTHDAASAGVHQASARLFDLYAEIFCDRGALIACGDLHTAVAMQVKVETGLKAVSAESYLRQAEEVFTKDKPSTDGLTHPESFIRARALRLWSESGPSADEDIRLMIQGPMSLQDLDLLGQQVVSDLTRRVVDALLSAPWLQTELTLAHARLFFEDYAVPAVAVRADAPDGPDEELVRAVEALDGTLKEYLCYVLLDFATADRGLEDMPLAAALLQARALGIEEAFGAIATKELRLRKKQMTNLAKPANEMVAGAEEMEKPS